MKKEILTIKFLMINVSSFILNDLLIYITSSKSDKISHWEEIYKKTQRKYEKLVDQTKYIIHFFLEIIEKTDFNSFAVKDEEILKHINELNEHISNVDLKILQERCSSITELKTKSQLSRQFGSYDITNKSKL